MDLEGIDKNSLKKEDRKRKTCSKRTNEELTKTLTRLTTEILWV